MAYFTFVYILFVNACRKIFAVLSFASWLNDTDTKCLHSALKKSEKQREIERPGF